MRRLTTAWISSYAKSQVLSSPTLKYRRMSLFSVMPHRRAWELRYCKSDTPYHMHQCVWEGTACSGVCVCSFSLLHIWSWHDRSLRPQTTGGYPEPDVSLRLALSILTSCHYRQNTETHRQTETQRQWSIGATRVIQGNIDLMYTVVRLTS